MKYSGYRFNMKKRIKKVIAKLHSRVTRQQVLKLKPYLYSRFLFYAVHQYDDNRSKRHRYHTGDYWNEAQCNMRASSSAFRLTFCSQFQNTTSTR